MVNSLFPTSFIFNLFEHTFVAATTIILVTVIFSVAGFTIVYRKLPNLRHEENNDVTTFIFGIVAGLYAILLGFLVVVVWQDFGDAQTTTLTEVTRLSNLLRDAAVFDDDQRVEMRKVILTYTNDVAKYEWKTMARGHSAPEAAASFAQIWGTFDAVQPNTTAQNAMYEVFADRLNDLGEARRIRLLQSTSSVPMPLWILIILGGALTLAYTWVFYVKNWRTQVGSIIILSVLLGFVFFLIYALQHPFTGGVSISKAPYISLYDEWKDANLITAR